MTGSGAFPGRLSADELGVMAASLRLWAQETVVALCAEEKSLPLPPIKEMAPVLRAHAARRSRRSLSAFRSRLRFSSWTAAPSTMQHILIDAATPAGRLGRLWARLRVRSGRPVEYLPLSVVDALGNWAWQDISFSAAVASELRASLAGRHLFSSGELPQPKLHPNTYWLLLSLACSVPRRGILRWGGAHRRKCLRRWADQLWMRPAWAGFWEQWAIASALCRALGSARPDGRTRKHLVSLPLLQSPLFLAGLPDWLDPVPASKPEGRPEDDVRAGSLATADWLTGAPPWIDSSLSGLGLAVFNQR